MTTPARDPLAALTKLPLHAPPSLEEAIGYTGPADRVAFYWEPGGDEACYHDGREGLVGANWHSYLLFVRHPSVAPHLRPYDLGSSDEPAQHWLLLARPTRQLYVGPAGLVHAALLAQWPSLQQQHDNPSGPQPDLQFDLEQFLAAARNWHNLSNEQIHRRIQQHMEQAHAAYERLQDELSTYPRG